MCIRDRIHAIYFFLEAKGSTRRFSARIAEKRWRKVNSGISTTKSTTSTTSSSVTTTLPAFPKQDIEEAAFELSQQQVGFTEPDLLKDRMVDSSNKLESRNAPHQTTWNEIGVRKRVVKAYQQLKNNQLEMKSSQQTTSKSNRLKRHQQEQQQLKESPIASMESNCLSSTASSFPVPPLLQQEQSSLALESVGRLNTVSYTHLTLPTIYSV